MSVYSKFVRFYRVLFDKVSHWLVPFVLFGFRLQIANVFLASGLSKWNGFFQFNADKYDLFLYEFFCPDPIRPGALLLCNPDTLDYEPGSTMIGFIEFLAVMAGVVEVALPILLIVGLLSRFASIGLIGMTLFIQLAVFPEWGHWVNPASWWFGALMVLLVFGPGKFSLDRFIGLEKKSE
ncbi:DoxX family protein [Marinomonas algicola]|jgi:putative oxidoreductase|uniref:DoxX family protein n=1 Tax=Marinomonas algicola TaxID=2773454 RepID=UPI00174D29A9|nr:DoxX family protein [Marinomonas algicola]